MQEGYNCSLEISKWGPELQNGAGAPKKSVASSHWQTGTWHACTIFSPNQLQRKLCPTADSKDFIGCVDHSVNLFSYTMLQKMQPSKPTPHLTLTLTSEIGAEKKVSVQEISSYIYAFSRCFYPKQFTVHSGHTFVLLVYVFPGNRTHNLCTANAML